MKIPGVTEEDIRSEVLNGKLRPLLAGGSLVLVSSSVNFTTADTYHYDFLKSIGILAGQNNENFGPAQAQTSWYIDPSNITGLANDVNSGLTSATPLKTYKEIIRRWGTNAPIISQNTVIIFMSDQPDISDPVNLNPYLQNSAMFLSGTLSPIISDTISTFTTLNRASGTDNTIAGTLITDFTPYGGMIAKTTLTSLTVTALGTTPPTVTFTGAPRFDLDPIQVVITLGGILGVAAFSWSINGIIQSTGILTASTVVLGTTGITANFAAGTYNTNNTYTAFSSAMFWIDSPTGDFSPVHTIGATAPITPPMTPCISNGLYFGFTNGQALGTNPPAATFTGVPAAVYHPIQVSITVGGARGVATFSWSINGIIQGTNILTAPAVTLDLTGATINFPVGTYSTDNIYRGLSLKAFASGPNGSRPPVYQTIANGLPFTIYKPTKVYLTNTLPAQWGEESEDIGSALYISNIWRHTVNDPAFFALGRWVSERTCLQQCRVDSQYDFNGTLSLQSVQNSMMVGGGFACGIWFYGGAIGGGGNPLTVGAPPNGLGVCLDGDIICHSSPGVYIGALVLGSVHLKGGTITLRNIGHAYLTPNGRGIFYSATAAGGTTSLWGNGRIIIRDGGSFRIVNTAGVTATNSLLLTGTPTVTIDGLSASGGILSSYIDDGYGVGAWSTQKATTPLATLVAALDTVGSGVTYAILNPNTGSRICMNGNNNAS